MNYLTKDNKMNNKIIVNGIEYNGNNISISNNKVIIDGKSLAEYKVVDVTIIGNCGDIDAGGSVKVTGNVTGNIDCGGSVDISGDVGGDIDAGGSIRISK